MLALVLADAAGAVSVDYGYLIAMAAIVALVGWLGYIVGRLRNEIDRYVGMDLARENRRITAELRAEIEMRYMARDQPHAPPHASCTWDTMGQAWHCSARCPYRKWKTEVAYAVTPTRKPDE